MPIIMPTLHPVTHSESVWRERSDFIFAAAIQTQDGSPRTEQLWGRQINECTFELCCIPFFLYDVALGDIVETDESYMVTRVVSASGRYVFRVWFGESFHPRDAVAAELSALDALTEWYSRNLLAVDARDLSHAETISGYLQHQEDAGRLVYETGKTS